jgi:hypothetical protein
MRGPFGWSFCSTLERLGTLRDSISWYVPLPFWCFYKNKRNSNDMSDDSREAVYTKSRHEANKLRWKSMIFLD